MFEHIEWERLRVNRTNPRASRINHQPILEDQGAPNPLAFPCHLY